ncbi:Na+/H+ antiporter subunit C [Pseudooceanicola atlanticus]|uniref:Na+/H+ antiporter subunit C n=1 Tax=Pseudooceanicola atlanticus TaxID=1461694 RepID=UPI000693B48D|nr:Na+/H+ antiporter subunit C [Pseudooceanicola atlanticus]
MELLIASAIGALTAAGIYLVLRLRTFPVILGTSLLSYAVNVFLFATGRLVVDQPPILRDDVTSYTDPLPQALVLTAIVISFGMTAVVVIIALGAYLSGNDDHVDDQPGLFSEDGDDADSEMGSDYAGGGKTTTTEGSA